MESLSLEKPLIFGTKEECSPSALLGLLARIHSQANGSKDESQTQQLELLFQNLESRMEQFFGLLKLNYVKSDFVTGMMDEYLALAGSSISKSSFDAVFHSIGDPVIVLNCASEITLANRALLEIGDYKLHEIENQHISILVNGLRPFTQAFDQEKPGRNIFRSELYLKLRQGKQISISISISPLYENEELEGWVCLLKDITQDIAYEKKLFEAKEAAEAAARVKSEFLANMSHEIRTPLNGILGLTQYLLDTRMDEDQKDCLQTIHRSGGTLLRLLNDVLDFSKLESGKIIFEERVFSPLQIIGDVCKLFNKQAQDKGLVLEVNPLQPISGNTKLLGDDHRIKQILSNLIGNAVKFTKEGRISIQTELLLSEKEDHYYFGFSVKDTGPGISLEKQTLLFQSFSQIDASITREHGGTGLGLSICHHLCSLMGGGISVKSDLNEGAEFTARIKIGLLSNDSESEKVDEQQEKLESSYKNRNNSDATAVSEHGNSVQLGIISSKILLVEDNPINQKVAIKTLSRAGLVPDLACNGEEALHMAQLHPYQLILMDLQMPKMDGLEATRELKKILKTACPPIVALTANVQESDRQRCEAAGMSDFLSKPILIQSLHAVLQKYLVNFE